MKNKHMYLISTLIGFTIVSLIGLALWQQNAAKNLKNQPPKLSFAVFGCPDNSNKCMIEASMKDNQSIARFILLSQYKNAQTPEQKQKAITAKEYEMLVLDCKDKSQGCVPPYLSLKYNEVNPDLNNYFIKHYTYQKSLGVSELREDKDFPYSEYLKNNSIDKKDTVHCRVFEKCE